MISTEFHIGAVNLYCQSRNDDEKIYINFKIDNNKFIKSFITIIDTEFQIPSSLILYLQDNLIAAN